ncbi:MULTISPECIES: alpha,alpha-phosphotrehalase [Erwiniaceae]|uniref:Alpha,alpha-phosphotrehalase n=1 Tax=Pantoea rwandensis TaxID=1076550 RepID=A0ABM5REJ5_9GAMM|nr:MULTISPECIES: alpha,alpha-phosphotrehalase [Erwiniaceae]AIR84419.1 trehalose-6-phosphate hydrolase [Pantoea rwandensis]MBK0093887.1 alpha,alpha-phosphotrehalase [Erwinia sp. S59]MBK0126812.1 alpha,alpha-phosphotrehalase [Pantoea sp. S61]
MEQLNSNPWWKNAVIYQIYPKSFQDSTGNGQGDINGITQRLPYLKKLGIDAIWLTPMYVSPQVDNGYDVADYCNIDPSYGTLADFLQLIATAHQYGIRVVMDMVFNHTSTQHPWFKQAENPESPYRDFYIWKSAGQKGAPNNWQSKFGGSAWQWHEQSQQYYLHLFSHQQADLNWQHPPVREALKNVCRFWAELGVDGLRLDVVNLVSKLHDFPNDTQGDGRRYYTDGPHIHDYLQEFSREIFQPLQLMTVGEMSSTSLEHCRQYAAIDGRELSMTFNFHHLKVDYKQGEKWSLVAPDFVALKTIFRRWQQGMHGHAWNALFWCNHDQPRIVSRFGNDDQWRVLSAKMLAMLLHGMQGTPFIYQGEEIGMTNPGFNDISQYRDVETLNLYSAYKAQGRDESALMRTLACKSRDNGRTPMQWDTSPHAGFSQAEPWISLCENFREINVEQALSDPDSVFYLYQQLIHLRKTLPVLTEGNYIDLLPNHPSLWCYTRHATGHSTLKIIANLSSSTQTLDSTMLSGRLLLSNYRRNAANTTLRPYECLYLTLK